MMLEKLQRLDFGVSRSASGNVSTIKEMMGTNSHGETGGNHVLCYEEQKRKRYERKYGANGLRNSC